MQHGLNGKLQLGDYLNARARTKIQVHTYRRDHAFAPAIQSITGKNHHEFLAHSAIIGMSLALFVAYNSARECIVTFSSGNGSRKQQPG